MTGITGHYFYPKDATPRKLEADFGRGIGSTAARQVADRLSRVPFDTYVEPFLGRGDLTRAIKPRGRVVLNDLDCHRVKQAERSLCRPAGSPEACKLVHSAGCGRDWREFLREDSPRTLFVLDPPWEGKIARDGMAYGRNQPIPAADVVAATRGLKGSVAVVYHDDPKARAALCHSPFRCTPIRRQFFGRAFTQLLAVKQAGG